DLKGLLLKKHLKWMVPITFISKWNVSLTSVQIVKVYQIECMITVIRRFNIRRYFQETQSFSIENDVIFVAVGSDFMKEIHSLSAVNVNEMNLNKHSESS